MHSKLNRHINSTQNGTQSTVGSRGHSSSHTSAQVQLTEALRLRSGCPRPPPHQPPKRDDEPKQAAYLPLSRTTDRVLKILLEGDLSRLRAENVAESLGISCTTLRRRLRNDHTSYQFLLDRARQYRCESRLRERWLPGKCFADELGYLEVNSFYRAFRRWTGLSYSEYKESYH
ncbi:MAG: helix-turn-helix domain-containing protein [Congregibacter sp.]